MHEITIATDAIHEILSLAIRSYKTGDLNLARKVEPLEEVNDEMIEEIRSRHVHRMTQGLCNVINGIEFQNILQNLERISDQCSDLAVYMLGRTDDSINGKEHLYIHELHHSGDPVYPTGSMIRQRRPNTASTFMAEKHHISIITLTRSLLLKITSSAKMHGLCTLTAPPLQSLTAI